MTGSPPSSRDPRRSWLPCNFLDWLVLAISSYYVSNIVSLLSSSQTSAGAVELDVTQKQLILDNKDPPYHLDVCQKIHLELACYC